jgi:type IV pilus assembly protein PilY1
MALFEANEDGFPLWDGNLKKLRIEDNPFTGKPELQDANGLNAIDIDGRIRRDALTFWTDPAQLPLPGEDEVAGADGRAVARGGAGQKVPGYVSGNPGLDNTAVGGRRIFTDDAAFAGGLRALDADALTAEALWPEITADWNPAPALSYGAATKAEQDLAESGHARSTTAPAAGARWTTPTSAC